MEGIKRYIKKSPVNSAFLAIIIVYFTIMTLGGGTTDIEILVKYGAFFPPFIAEYNEYYRYITSIFIHIGITHLLFNSYALYIFGTQIEEFMGSKKYLAFFLLTGIVGNVTTYLASYFSNFFTVSAGASGSLFGLLGAFFYLIIHHKDMISKEGKKNILTLLGINLLITIAVPNISVTAHLGGFVMGYLSSFIFIK